MTITSINLQHKNIKIDFRVEGIEPVSMEGMFQEVFSKFMEEVASTQKENATNTYVEMYKNMIKEQKENAQHTILADKNNNTEAVDKSKLELASRNKIMEELLRNVDERNYRVHDGVYRFQVFYICEKCNHKGKAFVEQRPTFCCRECGHTMNLIPATDRAFPFNDRYGNFYVAGKYKRHSDYCKQNEEVYQFKLEKEMAESDGTEKPKKLQVK